MTDTLINRGPDDQGKWIDAEAGVALGHRRLAVVDLSAAGHQPMESACCRYLIVFNGEIYNHNELRKEIGETDWRGNSDTETLLAGFRKWGVEECLRRCVGMFALALWDRQTRSLFLARDRMGEKPLYFGWQKESFLFGSGLDALRCHPAFQACIDRDALAELIRGGYVCAPRSIFSGISKLEPGHWAEVRHDGSIRISCYWDLDGYAATGQAAPITDAQEAVDELERLLKQSLRGQMIADVPLGAFLSGGIDSSTVVALMQSLSHTPVRTFTIGFQEAGYNEAEDAKAVAAHLGTRHTELYVTADDALALIPGLPQAYDEPFADMSQIPTMLVSRLARQHVTVALSGDAGDELFCGYGRYPQAVAGWKRLSQIPYSLRRFARPLLPRGRIKAGIGSKDVDAFYRYLNTQWKEHQDLVIGSNPDLAQPSFPGGLDPMARMMFHDMKTYLPDDILAKVDRAAMACSLETRVPLLDHRIVEFAWRLPTKIKYCQGVGKWPLKELLYRYVPRELVDRPKKGFGVPMHAWLRGSLREWAEELLSESRLKSEGYLRADSVRSEWKKHLDGRGDRHYGLWAVLMFQAWLGKVL